MGRPDDHEHDDRDAKQRVAPAALGGRHSQEPQRGDGVGGRDRPQPPLLEPDRRMGEWDGGEQAEGQRGDQRPQDGANTQPPAGRSRRSPGTRTHQIPPMRSSKAPAEYRGHCCIGGDCVRAARLSV